MRELPLVACCAPLTAHLTDSEADELGALFGALADKNRVKILSMLQRFGTGTCCVCASSRSSGSASRPSAIT